MNKKLIFGLAIGVITISISVFLSINLSFFSRISADRSCITETRDEEVLGNSMEPMIKAHSTITALYGYYDCNEVKRNDIVLFRHLHSQYPLIKRAVAIPGDSFDFTRINGEWHLTVNDETVKNSEGKPYVLNSHARTILGVYQDQYKAVLPDNIYIILGDQVNGTLDSTKFGVVDSRDFLAKAEL